MKQCIATLLLCIVCSATSITQATEKQKLLSQQTYKVLIAAQEAQEKGEPANAITSLKQLLVTLKGKPYEQAIVLQNLAYAYIGQEDYVSAIVHLKRCVELNALPPEPQQQALYNLIRLYMGTEGFAEAIGLLKAWLAQVEKPQAETYVMLATAHLQLGDFQEAIKPLRKAIQITKKPKESWYQSLLGAYSELKQYPQCTTLLHTMLKHFPDRPTYWRQLAGIQLLQEQYPDALATMELAYLRGHVETEQELLNLAQLYLHLNAPYKAAALIENEIKRRRIDKTEENWEHAANAWLLARETSKAAVALEKAKAIVRNPQLGLRLAQLYMEASRWAEAGKMLDSIISDGKLGATDTGQAWILLGIVRHEAKLTAKARAAFEQAKKYRKTANAARQWLAFLDRT